MVEPLPFSGYHEQAVYDRDDLDAADRKKLRALGFIARGSMLYHPRHWRPDPNGDLSFYESSFQSLTLVAALFAKDGPPES